MYLDEVIIKIRSLKISGRTKFLLPSNSMGRYLVIVVFSFFVSCNTVQPISSVGFKGYPISKTAGIDSVYLRMLGPYADSLGKTMDQLMAFASVDLIKDLPNSSLGNFMADAYLYVAKEKFDKRVDVAFMNHGGVRINKIPMGPISRRAVFEVMPFDNQLVIVELSGDVLQAYLDKFASEGGGGGVAGLTMKIKDKKAVDVLIGGKKLDAGKVYFMVNSDYAVDGGGGFSGLRKLPQQRTQYLQRDAILDYCTIQLSTEKKIDAEPLIRISHE
jgi:2',3'-cyclic-nucleotide 2'-phosphodiesterase (5'-nucleotidase family)